MHIRKKIPNNTTITNLIRRLVVKLIVKLDKLVNSNKGKTVLDKITPLQLSVHYLNFYKSYLARRAKLYNKESFKTSSVYSIGKEFGNSLFFVDINKFVGYEGAYYFGKDSPLSKTAIQLIESVNLKVEDSILFSFYKEFQPRNYGELYDLTKKNILYYLSSNTIFMPWLHKFPQKGFHAGVFGPKDKSSIKHRLLRLNNIIQNINTYGYIPTEKDSIEGYIAILDGDYRFVITGGHHRVAVLKAFNMINSDLHNFVSVKYESKRVNYKIVNNKAIDNWPGIKSGYLNSRDSIEFYEKYFN